MEQVNCCWTLWMTAVSSKKHEEGVKHAILKIGVSKKLFAREKPLQQKFNWFALIFIPIWKSEISPCQQISRTTGTSQSPRSEYLRMSRNKEQPISSINLRWMRIRRRWRWERRREEPGRQGRLWHIGLLSPESEKRHQKMSHCIGKIAMVKDSSS